MAARSIAFPFVGALLMHIVLAAPVTPCPASSGSGWPYANFTLSSNATHVLAMSSEIPPGFIDACMWTDPASAVAIHVDTTMSAVVDGKRVTWNVGMGLPAVDRAALPICTPNYFPIQPFDVKPGDACEYTPPWCSSELCFNFVYHFTAPGLVEFRMPVDCRC